MFANSDKIRRTYDGVNGWLGIDDEEVLRDFSEATAARNQNDKFIL